MSFATRVIPMVLTVGLMAVPTAAFAHCSGGTANFAVSCESGVTVIRHRANSAMPIGLSPAQAKVKIAKMEQATARAKIAAKARADAAKAELKARELDVKQYRAQVYNRNSQRGRYVSYGHTGFGYGFGTGGGYTVARPIRVRAKH